jgi:hypothetical protein
MNSHSLSSNEGFGCPSASKLWEAQIASAKAREELNDKKYSTADATIKLAISKLGIPEGAPRCKDCMDEGNLQFPLIEYEEYIGNIADAASIRYDDLHDLIKLYLTRQCHTVRDPEWTDRYPLRDRAPMVSP